MTSFQGSSYRPLIAKALRMIDRLDQSATPLPQSLSAGDTGAIRATERAPTVGSQVGPCRLIEELGRGASGVVFRAEHLKLDIPVAVKVLHGAALDESPILREQLRIEGMALARLNHPNVIRVWDFDHQGRWPYLVMEYVTGCSLAERIRQVGRLPQDWALSIVRDVAAGLAAAERVGIIHRDVKPANVLTAADGTVKLADLGLAQFTSRSLTNAAPGQTPLAGSIHGTAAYMAPEHARGEAIDHRADIYSLGCTLYHTLTGQLPFAGRSAMQMIFQHLQQPPPRPSERVPELESAVDELVVRMLAKQPDERFARYDDLIAALDAILG